MSFSQAMADLNLVFLFFLLLSPPILSGHSLSLSLSLLHVAHDTCESFISISDSLLLFAPDSSECFFSISESLTSPCFSVLWLWNCWSDGVLQVMGTSMNRRSLLQAKGGTYGLSITTSLLCTQLKCSISSLLTWSDLVSRLIIWTC